MKKILLQNKYYILLLIVFIPKLYLLGQGALSLPDENRYIRVYDGFVSLIEKFDFSHFFSEIIINAAIPGSQLLFIIPVSVQYVIEQMFGINHLYPVSLIVPQVFNLIVLFLTSVLIFKFQDLFYVNKRLSFLVSFIYVSLVNTNVYLRHTFSYDLGIFFAILAIYYTIKAFRDGSVSKSKLLKVGFLSSFSVSVFIGYFFTPLFTFLLIIFLCYRNIKNIKSLFPIFVYYSLGFFSLIVIYEIMGRIGGTSYVMSVYYAYFLYHDFPNFDFNEGFIFPVNYLLGIEGLIGLLLLAFSIIGIISLSIDTFIKKKKLTVYSFILWISIVCYFLFAFQCYFLDKMVWYGRVFHFYYFFIINLAIYAIDRHAKNKPLVNIFIIFFICVSIISFFHFFKEYNNIAYPRDIIAKEKIDLSKVPQSNKLYSIYWNSEPFFTDFIENDPNYKNNSVFVNLGFLWPSTDNSKKFIKIAISDSLKLTYECSHYLTYKPYLYEGHNKEQRHIMGIANPKIQIYKKR